MDRLKIGKPVCAKLEISVILGLDPISEIRVVGWFFGG